METKKYSYIVTGEYYWSGNLEKYVQYTQVKVLYPSIDSRGKKLNGKVVIESCLKNKQTKAERDHASVRLDSIQQCYSLYVSLVLAIREYSKMLPIETSYVYSELSKRLPKIFQGEYDVLVRKGQ